MFIDPTYFLFFIFYFLFFIFYFLFFIFYSIFQTTNRNNPKLPGKEAASKGFNEHLKEGKGIG